MKKKIIRLTEEDLVRIVKKVVSEQNSTNIGTVKPEETVKLGLKKTTNNKELNVLYEELKDFMSNSKTLKYLYDNFVYIQNDEKIIITNLFDVAGRQYKITEVTKDNGEWWVNFEDEKVPLSDYNRDNR